MTTTTDNMDCAAGCLRARWAADVAALQASTPATDPEFTKLAALSFDIAMKPCATYCDTHDIHKENNGCK